MIRTQIQLEAEDMERLKRAAQRRACSISAFVRESVRATLNRAEQEHQVDTLMALAGKYSSGRGDLSRNHDTYLDEGW